MKALSIRQPYAFAIAMGWKPVENRTWRTDYRGRVAIHASRREDKDAVADVLFQIACDAITYPHSIKDAYEHHVATGGLGSIVGTAEIVDCVTDMDSPWFSGPYGFVMSNARHFDKPIPFVGQLSLFDLTPEVDALIEARAA